jgi:ribosomal protein S18 acetylase RimI-like enzyme
MIKRVEEQDIAECVKVIKESFATVAKEFGFTVENAPRFTAFATTEDRLKHQLLEENRPMYAFYDNENIVGYYSLLVQDNNECELNNLSVIPAYRHRGIGEELLKHTFKIAKELNCNKINIGIVEENNVLRKWYESFEFIHIGTQKFDFFPFTCGYMEKNLQY